MADKEREEESEHYYKSNPSKPKAVKQYNQPVGPVHPHANVKMGKEQGPTRADLEKEKQRKFKKDFEIEKNIHSARLRGEKADERAEAKRKKESDDAARKRIPKPRPAPRKSHRQPSRGRTRAPAPSRGRTRAPAPRGDFLPDMGIGYQATPMSITPPDFSLPFTGGFGNPSPRRRKKGRRQSSGINFGFTNPNYIPPGLKRFF